MDLANNVVRWMKTYQPSTSALIEALALNDNADKIAVYARWVRLEQPAYGSRKGTLFVISAENGNYVTERAL